MAPIRKNTFSISGVFTVFFIVLTTLCVFFLLIFSICLWLSFLLDCPSTLQMLVTRGLSFAFLLTRTELKHVVTCKRDKNTRREHHTRWIHSAKV